MLTQLNVIPRNTAAHSAERKEQHGPSEKRFEKKKIK
jgi:hypothetical protein